MPSTTPSNSRRRHSSTSSTTDPLAVSSTHGATKTAAAETSVPASCSSTSEYELTTSAMNVATTAPQPKANSSSDVGSASKRSSHSSEGPTIRTGTSATTQP